MIFQVRHSLLKIIEPLWVCVHTEDVTLKSAIAPVIKTWAVELAKVGTKNIGPKIVSFFCQIPFLTKPNTLRIQNV